ncbi:MAG: SusC/RagA family TonB-linked outer membrane protein [Niabella sp.]
MRNVLKSILVVISLFLLSSNLVYAQTVSGTVLADDDGTPMMGVTVTNENTKKRTSTNVSGYYSIEAENGNTLVFTFVGYAAKTVVIGNDRMISVRLVSNLDNLENVVVTGYGQARDKRTLAYQAPSVAGEDLAGTQRDNFLNALAGRVPGLQVTSTSGLPGASAQIMLRSGTSIGGNNAPLFIVDGMPVSDGGINQEDLAQSSGTAFANRNSDYSNRIADINPNDIESIVILKGPEATSQYGSDGASGAIVITTKKGISGKTSITYNNAFSFSNVYRYPQLQDVYTRGSDGVFNPDSYNTSYGYRFFGPRYPDSTVFYDNMRNFFETGFSQRHNISMTAGTNLLNYRLSASYNNTGGVVPNTNYRTYTFNLDAQAQLHKRVTLRSKVNYTNFNNEKATKGAGSYYVFLMTYPRDIDASNYINADGTRMLLRNAGPQSELNNPFWDVNKNRSNDNGTNVLGNINLDIKIAKGLSATGILGINHVNQLGSLVYHPYSREYYAQGGLLSTYERSTNSITGTGRLNYHGVIGKKITNDAYLGAYFEDMGATINSQRGERFYEVDFVSIMNTEPTSRLATLTQYKIRKTRYYAGYTFGYNNFWYVTLTGTREGVSTFMSKFRENQPFFSFGSVSSSLILSDLDFLKAQKEWLNFAKLRFSYATSGKGPYSPYVIDPAFRSVTSTGGGFAYGVTGNNFGLKPEISRNIELGGEAQFLDKRLSIDVAWFRNDVNDNIYATRVSYVSGTILRYVNGGQLTAKGWEIQLKGQPIKNKKYGWDIVVNFDKAKTIVNELPGDLPFYYDSDTWVMGNVRSQVAVGQSLATLSGYTFEKNDKGQLLINPLTGLPTQSIATFTQIGDRQPDYKIGIINNISYANWNLSFNLDLRKGGDVFNANELMMTIMGISKRTLDREQPRVIQGVLKDGLENTDNPTVNTIAVTPYFRSTYYNGVFAEADYIEKVNWMRMRDMTLAYRFGTKLLQKQKVFRSASLFATVTDLFLITNYSGMDPNTNALNSSNARGFGGAGIDYGSIPSPRTYSFGLKVGF